jgi:hypothetical protein
MAAAAAMLGVVGARGVSTLQAVRPRGRRNSSRRPFRSPSRTRAKTGSEARRGHEPGGSPSTSTSRGGVTQEAGDWPAAAEARRGSEEACQQQHKNARRWKRVVQYAGLEEVPGVWSKKTAGLEARLRLLFALGEAHLAVEANTERPSGSSEGPDWLTRSPTPRRWDTLFQAPEARLA